ncbi:MAG: hypothetical protein F4Y03_06250 [Alphaproteobacteria bacterium]|nr:hypothetical protein [Alphaproteobacteria bacterium]
MCDDQVREAWLTCARKNGKSGLIAAVILGFLAPDGPLRRENWRGLVVSMTGALAGELRRQVEEIVAASSIQCVEVRRSPAPGRLVGISGTVDILAADKASGHAAGADLAIIDEAGLLPERRRPLWDAISTAVSGRDGRIVGISVLGDGPMFREALDRDGEPGIYVRRYEAPADCDLSDPAAWAAANPGLADGIKSPGYMEHKAREAVSNPASAAGFRSLDLNQPIAPTVELVCDVEQWRRVESDQVPERGGRCFLGVDLGGSVSLTAAAALWETGRLECWVAIPSEPEPLARGRRDGVGDAYVRAIDGGHLTVCGRLIVDARAFLAGVLDAVPRDVVIGCDRYRKAELLEVLAALDKTPTVRWRGVGASATADGSYDVRAFQTAIAERTIRTAAQPMMRLALAGAAVRRDANGNPALDKASGTSRIDLVSAAAIACGLRRLAGEKSDRPRVFVA